ncbi:hypothetical protein A9Q99_13150 [Gammaproteobacteria bacterium 45_16_T64]|nr:hypothetical protein A9Q99_13150 [Gammaproteobacteria bacterium 45_16_T64]
MKKIATAMSVMTLALTMQGCGSSSSSEESTELYSLYQDLADNIIIPNYQASSTAAAGLAGASGSIQQYCDAIGSGSEATALTTAKNAWLTTMAAWQRAEVHKFGPVTDDENALQNRILPYADLSISTCGIDQAAVSAQDVSFDFDARSRNQKGLGSIEYLLFNTDLTHTCPSQITETTDWNARTEQERKEWRCDLARIVADDLSSAMASVTTEWELDGSNYRGVFINPEKAEEFLTAISDGLFYLETIVKDKKLGIAMGISSSCSDFTCPSQLESAYSESSLANIKVNLESFEDFLTGNGGLGLDSLISDAGVPQVTEDLLQYVDDAITEINNNSTSAFDQATEIDSTLEETECTNATAAPDTPSSFPACNLYGHVKNITDTLKSGFVAAISQSIPEGAQSDND